MEPASADPPEPLSLVCPSCGGGVEATPAAAPQIVSCPQCNQAIIVPAADGSMPAMARAQGEAAEEPFVVDDLTPEEQRKARDDLDARHIQNVAHARRSAYRTRSWALIALVLCAVGALQLLFYAFFSVSRSAGALRIEREPFGTWPFAKMMAALILLALAYRFWGRARQLKREADRTELREPQVPPDFAPLSDGSQRYKNLEDVDDNA